MGRCFCNPLKGVTETARGYRHHSGVRYMLVTADKAVTADNSRYAILWFQVPVVGVFESASFDGRNLTKLSMTWRVS